MTGKKHNLKSQGAVAPRRHGTRFGASRLVVTLLAFLVVAVFAIQNDRPVTLVLWGYHAPAVGLSLILFASLLLGGVAVLALGAAEVRSLRRQLMQVRAELVRLQTGAGPGSVTEPLAGLRAPASEPRP